MIERQKSDRSALEALSRIELLRLAKDAGLPGRDRLSKEELVLGLLGPDAILVPSGRSARAKARGEGVPTPLAPPDSSSGQPPSGPGVPLKSAPPYPWPGELPTAYGRTCLTLMDVDPHHVYAYWEISPEEAQAAGRKVQNSGSFPAWALRFYDVTLIQFDGTNAHGYFDVPVDLAAGNWYVDLWSDEKSYCAEIGPRGGDGRFVPVCRSNVVQTPRATPSPRYEPRFTRVEAPLPPQGSSFQIPGGRKGRPAPSGTRERGDAAWSPESRRASPASHLGGEPASQKRLGSGAGSAGPASPGSLEIPIPAMDEIRRRYEELAGSGVPPSGGGPQGGPQAPRVSAPGDPPGAGVPSFEGIQILFPFPPVVGLPSSESSFGLSSGEFARPPEASIRLELGADLIIYGRAEPGQTLQVNGQSVTVRPDGTFRVQLSLPKSSDKD